MASLKQLVNWTQNITILALVSVPFPAAFASMFELAAQFVSVLDLDAAGPECFGAREVLNWDVRFFVTMFLCVAIMRGLPSGGGGDAERWRLMQERGVADATVEVYGAAISAHEDALRESCNGLYDLTAELRGGAPVYEPVHDNMKTLLAESS